MLFCVLVVCLLQLVHSSRTPTRRQIRYVDSLVHRWAPLVWLAPGERFYPGGVEQFLENVVPTHSKQIEKLRASVKINIKRNVTVPKNDSDKPKAINLEEEAFLEKDTPTLPFGTNSKDWFLTVKGDIGELMNNSSSFIHGYNPLLYSVPVYAIVKHCLPQKRVKVPFQSHIHQMHPHIHHESYRTSTNKQKDDSIEDELDSIKMVKYEKQRTEEERDENSNSYMFNSEEMQSSNNPFKRQGNVDESLEALKKLGPNKIRLRRQDVPKDGSHNPPGPDFTVTYWLFFPFSEGKEVCVVETGPRLLGPWPLPLLGGHCLGKRRRYGSHLGDWEHLSIHFVNGQPQSLYISTHKLGAYYKYFNQRGGLFRLYRHELREAGHVEGWLQRPRFPRGVHLSKPFQATPGPNIPNSSGLNTDTEWMRPTLFAARGSHGLWAAPGHHQYVRYPQLEDSTGYGTPWATWTNLQILHHTKDHALNSFVQKKSEPTNKEHINPHPPIQKDHNLKKKEESKSTPGYGSNNIDRDGENDYFIRARSDWPSWMAYEGHWGEPRSGCHEALSKLGVGGWSCEYSDGPRGIPAKRSHYSCS